MASPSKQPAADASAAKRPPELSCDASDALNASQILTVSARKGLGARPRLRLLAGVLWSGFIGASLALLVLLIVPDQWLMAPVGFGRLAVSFCALWLLALVPALSAALLSGPRGIDDAR